MADTNLKPCPFCGSKRLKVCKKNNGTKYVNGFSHRIERHTYSVRCNSCMPVAVLSAVSFPINLPIVVYIVACQWKSPRTRTYRTKQFDFGMGGADNAKAKGKC